MSDENIVVLQDEDGNDARFVHIMTFDFAESVYVALTPETQVDSIKNGEVMLVEILEDADGNDIYEPIDSVQKLSGVWEEFQRVYEEDEE